MPGFAYYGNANGYDIWENQYYIPMGFSYDYYITRSEYNALNEGSENAIHRLFCAHIPFSFLAGWRSG